MSPGLSAFWAELKRRKVMRVAITYAIASIAIIEFASATFGWFNIPAWAFRLVTLYVILGFPIAVIIAWAFELTPDGIKTTKASRSVESDTDYAAAHSKKRNWLAYAVGAILPTVIFGALALFFYVRSGGDGAPEIGEKSISVLPLENMSPDPENAFFEDGVQEDILTNLARIDELHVIARTSTQQYRDTQKTVETIGEELGVNYLVEGSVRRAGSRVKVTVQLIDCKNWNHLWVDDYDRNLDDIFAIKADVAKEIASQLRAVLSPKEIAQIEYRPTENQQAYDYYVKARSLEGAGYGSLDEIVEYLEEAVAHDPNFAEAWAQLAGQSIVRWEFGNHQDHELYKRAYEALEKAKRLGPDLATIPYALYVFALRDHHDPEASISYMLQTLAIGPNTRLANVMMLNRYYILGRLVEAQHYAEAAIRESYIQYNPYCSYFFINSGTCSYK